MIIQLILIDEKTKQPQKVESIENGYLDFSSPLQRQLYLNTIQHLTPHSELKVIQHGEEALTIYFDELEPGKPKPTGDVTIEVLDYEALINEAYPEEETIEDSAD